MKKIFSILLTLVLALSLCLVTAVPVSAFAGQVTYEKVTSPGQTIAENSDPTALFKVEIFNSTTDNAYLTKVSVDFENVSGFDKTDLAAVSVYRDGVRPAGESGTPFEPEDGDTLIDGTVTWSGLVAEVTFTNSELIVPKGTSDIINHFWVAIGTSATIANGDQFRATLRSQSSFEIDGSWEGADDIDADIITAEVPLESNTVVSLTGEVETITAINVTPTSIDFGTLYPGESSTEETITVENIGTVPVAVDALVSPPLTLFDNLMLGGGSLPSWRMDNLSMGDSRPVVAQVVVPLDYTSKGEETATLVFIATRVQ